MKLKRFEDTGIFIVYTDDGTQVIQLNVDLKEITFCKPKGWKLLK